MFIGLILAAAVLVGCRGGGAAPTEQASPTGTTTGTPAPTGTGTSTPTPADTATPTLTLTPSLTPTVIYPPEPRPVEFTAEDGKSLSGKYYPPGTSNAPILVLMHWAQGDQDNWTAVAGWVQNRGWQPEIGSGPSWKRSGWFPDFPEDLDLGVFTFTFRGCEDSCTGFPAAEWLLDAEAGIRAAAGLPGADPDRILTAGASIGADGAVDACSWWNQTGKGTCLGAFALSPGSFLTVPYDLAAGEILFQDPEGIVYCLYGRRDDAAMETCQLAPDAEIVDYGYIENHGMELIAPDLEQPTLLRLIDFLRSALGSGG